MQNINLNPSTNISQPQLTPYNQLNVPIPNDEQYDEAYRLITPRNDSSDDENIQHNQQQQFIYHNDHDTQLYYQQQQQQQQHRRRMKPDCIHYKPRLYNSITNNNIKIYFFSTLLQTQQQQHDEYVYHQRSYYQYQMNPSSLSISTPTLSSTTSKDQNPYQSPLQMKLVDFLNMDTTYTTANGNIINNQSFNFQQQQQQQPTNFFTQSTCFNTQTIFGVLQQMCVTSSHRVYVVDQCFTPSAVVSVKDLLLFFYNLFTNSHL
eukprot:UN00094